MTKLQKLEIAQFRRIIARADEVGTSTAAAPKETHNERGRSQEDL
jgi:hypothetical protein